MTECTQQEWEDFIVKYNYYCTEGDKHNDAIAPLVIKHIFGYDWKKNIIGDDALEMVRYHDNIHRTYYINKHADTPTKAQELIERTRK